MEWDRMGWDGIYHIFSLARFSEYCYASRVIKWKTVSIRYTEASVNFVNLCASFISRRPTKCVKNFSENFTSRQCNLANSMFSFSFYLLCVVFCSRANGITTKSLPLILDNSSDTSQFVQVISNRKFSIFNIVLTTILGVSYLDYNNLPISRSSFALLHCMRWIVGT